MATPNLWKVSFTRLLEFAEKPSDVAPTVWPTPALGVVSENACSYTYEITETGCVLFSLTPPLSSDLFSRAHIPRERKTRHACFSNPWKPKRKIENWKFKIQTQPGTKLQGGNNRLKKPIPGRHLGRLTPREMSRTCKFTCKHGGIGKQKGNHAALQPWKSSQGSSSIG